MFNFIYSSSNMYAPYCLTSMSSLLKNNPDLRECCFYILSNDISAAMRDKMELLCRKFNVKLQIIDCNPVIRSIFEGGENLISIQHPFYGFSYHRFYQRLIKRYL